MISISIPFPQLKITDVSAYQTAIDEWKKACQWAAKEFPSLVSSVQTCAPTMAIPAPEKAISDDSKGEWERKVNAMGKRLRVTDRLMAQYGTREAYAKFIYEGGKDDEPTQEETQEKVLAVPEKEIDNDDL